MEGVAQLAEHRVVASVAVGSSPTTLPTPTFDIIRQFPKTVPKWGKKSRCKSGAIFPSSMDARRTP